MCLLFDYVSCTSINVPKTQWQCYYCYEKEVYDKYFLNFTFWKNIFWKILFRKYFFEKIFVVSKNIFSKFMISWKFIYFLEKNAKIFFEHIFFDFVDYFFWKSTHKLCPIIKCTTYGFFSTISTVFVRWGRAWPFLNATRMVRILFFKLIKNLFLEKNASTKLFSVWKP